MSIISKLFGKSEAEAQEEEMPSASLDAAASASSDPSTSLRTGKKDTELWKQVESVLDLIRPAIQMDGGDVELVDLGDDGTVYIAMQGHCVGCPMSQMTLQMGIERTLKGHIPQVTRVVAV